MKPSYELGGAMLASAAAGWLVAAHSFIAGGFAALVAFAAYYEFERSYRRNLVAALKWRRYRWDELKALEAKYRADVSAQSVATPADLHTLWNEAAKRAAAEIAERLGPIT